jgi:repressor of nif and glnA expression
MRCGVASTGARGACFYPSLSVELAILELLAQHDRLAVDLAVDRIADELSEPQRAVGDALRLLAQQGFVRRVGATGWALTEAGREEVRQWGVA